MKVILTGSTGQLGRTLLSERSLFPTKLNLELIPLSRKELDLSDVDACKLLVKKIRPDWILNAGAYTSVDKAESEFDLAHAVNAIAPQSFAEALADYGGRLLQVSTDFVFSGNQGFPYKENHPIDPLGVYGATKAAGEKAALDYSGTRVLRTSWVYGPVGNNFCLTMLRLHKIKACASESLSVVADQVGCPTSTFTLAKACWRLISLDEKLHGHRIFHCSDAGVASWYDFAVAIGHLAVRFGLLSQAAEVIPIGTVDYPTPAKRPSYSLLDCVKSRGLLNLTPQHWHIALAKVLQKISSETIL